MKKIKIGIVSFTDPRAVKGINDIDIYNMQCENRLVKKLLSSGFDIVSPLDGIPVRSRKSAHEASFKLLSEDVDCLFFGCWKWTDPMLAVEVARRVDRPVCLIGENDPSSTALGCIAAIGAALWEIAPNSHSATHHRILGDDAAAVKWARGAGASSFLKKQNLLLWGGSYCLRMAHLDDDASLLKSFLIGDILVEDQYHIISAAEKILASNHKRASDFVNKLASLGASIEHDNAMLTPKILERQAALYLAARERLAELEDEDITGVSIKCQPALSETWGATGCLIPAFLPFSEDPEGPRIPIATTCEGDIKGLITSLLLQRFTDGIPAGFGDIRNVRVGNKEHLIISNCGAASIFYAAMSEKISVAAPAISMRGQCQGAGGAAIGYRTPPFGTATIARIFRKQGEYFLQYALAESKKITGATIKKLVWGDVWPISLFDIDMDLHRFTASTGSNHFSFVPGDFTTELSVFCNETGIEMECLN